MSDKATLMVGGTDSTSNSCLEHYFAVQRKKNSLRMIGSVANAESDEFEKDVRNLTNQLEQFLEEGERETSYLVLGKVQSGKTAHMVGSIAWAADSDVALVAAFTGVTEALNDQTFERFSADLSSNESFVSIHGVPTSTKGSQYQELKSKIFQYVQWRFEGKNKDQIFQPLPVLITLKNKHRVQTLKHLLEEIAENFGSGTTVMLIDDEADQASQNSKAYKNEVAATYQAISELRDTDIRNILLSYTATPQAVLLTEKFGRLRPNYCVTVKPRVGYFGITDAVSKDYEVNRIIVTDGTDSTTISSIPLSLKSTILDFFWTAWIRNRYPSKFYSNTGLSEMQLASKMKSTQMLVHESFRVINHEAMYKFVRAECDDLVKIIGQYLNGNLPDSSRGDLEDKLFSSLAGVCDRIDASADAIKEVALSTDGIRELLKYINENRILIVNGDAKRSTSDFKIPVEDKHWEQRDTWILIGGDILGRGLTIPQLTTTYFLRQAKQPNFDTVSQQMRFCGYRQDYRSITTIHAPKTIFNTFQYMEQIDSIVWERACKWDKHRLNIGEELPAVLYASPVNAPLAPTRKAVTDPNLVDKRIGEFVFTLKDVMSPFFFRSNLSLLNRWIEESIESGIQDEKFIRFEHVQPKNLQRLLSSWAANRSESRQLRASAELFELSYEHLGLADYPTTIFLDSSLLEAPVIGENCTAWIDTIKVTRRVNKKGNLTNFSKWKNSFENSIPTDQLWSSLEVGHVGDGQRKLKKAMPYDSSILLIEPILGVQESKKRDTALTAGIGLTFFAPDNYEVRVIGHS
jgi:hypothetical protein